MRRIFASLLASTALSAAALAQAPDPNALPPAAAQFGLTLAFNSDFTQPLSINWLRGCPDGSDGSRPTNYWGYDWGSPADGFSDWYLNLWWWWGNDTCNVSQVVDPKYGNLAIDLLWIVNQDNTLGTAIETVSPDYSSATGTGRVKDFSNGPAYYEVEFRMDPPGPHADGVFITWATSGADLAKGYGGMEFDVAEWVAGNPNGSDATVHNFSGPDGKELSSYWLIAPGTYPWWSIDPGQYQKFGMLTVPYNNNTQLYVCSYINDEWQEPCQNVPYFPRDYNNRNFLILNNTCDWWNGGCAPDGTVQHMYVTSVKVYQ